MLPSHFLSFPSLSYPSPLVPILPPHSTSTFIDPVGLTNTEYFTSKPVYGSNFNASNVKHVSEFTLSFNQLISNNI